LSGRVVVQTLGSCPVMLAQLSNY